ncbi:MAG: hypothetical protein LBT65_05020, partial [Synergistaceae bacterium]|nr:hypothetical protein [Synergistaceae bacterium]
MKKIVLTCLLILCAAGVGNAATDATVTTAEWLKDAILDPTSSDISLGDDIALTENITISRSLTLQGNDKSLSGSSISIINGTVELIGIEFQNATSGAISVSEPANAHFMNGKFHDNAGGAISVTGGTAYFNNSSFTGNTATADGGAVKVTAGDVTFDGVTFGGAGSGDPNSAQNGGA